MTTFPALVPSSRTFTPGEYPHTAYSSWNGNQGRVRHSNVMLSSQLRVGFIGLSESQMLSIVSHYYGEDGTYTSFAVPADLLSGVSNADDYTLTNYLWRYAEPPTVEDLPCGGHNVELVLESVPPEGVTTSGLASVVTVSITPGIAAAANGANLTITTAVSGGTAGGPGIDATVNASITAGSVSIIPAGINATVTTSVIGGVAAAANGLSATINVSIAGGTATEIITDPLFSSVSLLLHLEGSNGSTTFTDSSSNNTSVSATGSPSITTSTSKFGTGSLSVPSGINKYIFVAGSAAVPGTLSNFTVEFFFRPTGVGRDNLRNGIFAITGNIMYLAYYNNRTLRASSAGVAVGSASSALTLDQWHHIAIVRDGTTTTFYLDGSSFASGTNWNNSPVNLAGINLCFGTYMDGGSSLGYPTTNMIDEIRITKSARYTANFTAPTAQFPDS